MSTVFITQPTYLPWVGIFKAIELVDTFVFYDDVQVVRHSWHNRNRVLDPARRTGVYLTVPLEKHKRETLLADVAIADPEFYRDHLNKLRQWYRRAPFATETIDMLESAYSARHTHLPKLTAHLTEALARYIGLSTQFRFSHEFDIAGDKYTRPIALARELGGSTYLTQAGTREYTDVAAYEAAGMNVRFLEFEHPSYEQQATPFTAYLSIVDMLMNIGPAGTLSVIQSIELTDA